jgi:hypothetical protein
VRTRSLSRHAWVSMNLFMGGIADVRLTTASCPENAAVRAARSKIDTDTGSAPCLANIAAFSGVRASAVTVCPLPTRAGTAWPPIPPVPPVTNTFIRESHDARLRRSIYRAAAV